AISRAGPLSLRSISGASGRVSFAEILEIEPSVRYQPRYIAQVGVEFSTSQSDLDTFPSHASPQLLTVARDTRRHFMVMLDRPSVIRDPGHRREARRRLWRAPRPSHTCDSRRQTAASRQRGHHRVSFLGLRL